jgi:hypothetical protein
MDYKNKKVKLLLSGNIIVEGVVKSWNANSVHLISLDGSSTSIITHPNEDIRVIKVFEDKVEDVELPKNTTSKATVSSLQNKFEETYKQPTSDNLRLKKLVDLKKDLIQQEKEIIANKLKEHTVEEVRKVKYEQPGFFKKQIVK